jgi:hypothetical protein
MNLLKWSMTVLTSMVMLVFTSCSSEKAPGESSSTATYTRGVPGGTVVETYKTKATVTAVDTTDRKVTLRGQDGKPFTVTCGPEVVNFGQIQVGDNLKVTYAQQLVIFLSPNAAGASDGAAAEVVLTPVGAKPGGHVAHTVQLTATVTAIDLKHHKATMQFADGTVGVVAVRPDVDLTQRKVGETVVIRCTEALAIALEKS